MSASALAADIKPAIIYDLGGKFDKSFNEAAYTGAEKFKNETGIDLPGVRDRNDAQREQALRRFAGDGNNPIVMAGFSWGSQRLKRSPPSIPTPISPSSTWSSTSRTSVRWSTRSRKAPTSSA
jgi:basic membrane protein A